MKVLLTKILLSLVFVLSTQSAYADEASGTTTTTPAPAPAPGTSLQTKYGLTDAQMKNLTDSKLPESQHAKVARLAQASGKTTDEILKMRLEDKMGWGKIAKTLGVHPSALGKGGGDRKEENSERKKDRDSKRESKKNRDGKGSGNPDRDGKKDK